MNIMLDGKRALVTRAEMEDRHHLVFETFEEAKLTLKEYLDWVVFYRKRSFTRTQFQRANSE